MQMRKVDPVRHEEKRADILRAAGRCFSRHGFHGASIASICAEAGISAGHLYHYFDSKETMIAAIAGEGLAQATARYAHLLDAPDPIAALVLEISTIAGHSGSGDAGVLFDILAEAGRDAALGQILQKDSRLIRDMLAAVLRSGQERGMIDKDLEIEPSAAVLLSLVDAAKSLSVRAPDLSRETRFSALQTTIERLLAPRTIVSPT